MEEGDTPDRPRVGHAPHQIGELQAQEEGQFSETGISPTPLSVPSYCGFRLIDRERMRDRQWREERRGRGRERRWGPRGSNSQPMEEEEEEQGEEADSRLYSSLMDPQEVPRKGYFFEVQYGVHTSELPDPPI